MVLSDFMHFMHLFHLILKIRKTPGMRKSKVINGIRIITICKSNVKNEQNDFEWWPIQLKMIKKKDLTCSYS